VYGECDYCHEFKVVGARTKLCRECREHYRMVVDKYLDGDPLTPLKAAAYLIGEREEGK
jgi:hypothetical protein